MGKPRMIILIRHAQSEGNKNRDIHQFIPDHRVKLTADGWHQAEDAGARLRSLLRPEDTIQFFTSPYRRTRETTEGILRTLTSDDPAPSPFPRHNIKVFEEPRLREQDFGNFQPCSAEMERMWRERADYGHFFYRIPNGESAADAYDRVSGFNESLWRLFGEDDFPSVCVLVTHGLMTRVFLMKWYHWSVEEFEDLRNINHCEFIIMKQTKENGKYLLQNQLRTWSDLKRRTVTNVPPKTATGASQTHSKSPTLTSRRWGGCVNGCVHGNVDYICHPWRQNAADLNMFAALPDPAVAAPPPQRADNSRGARLDDDVLPSSDVEHTPTSSDADSIEARSSAGTPADGVSDDSDYSFPAHRMGSTHRGRSRARVQHKKTWGEDIGMGTGARADILGDGDSGDEAEPSSGGATDEQQHMELQAAKQNSLRDLGEIY